MIRSISRCLTALLFAVASHGCSSAPEKTHAPPNSITVEEGNPKRIRFVVHGDPGLSRYPEITRLPLPVHEQIREGMRRYAADELRNRNWCPNGFAGPALVAVYEVDRMTRRFYVDCL